MTQIVVTLENNADENLLRQMIENMKGVLKTTLTHRTETNEISDQDQPSSFMESVHDIKSSIDTSVIDYSDPRTQYILSK